jgi:hypothetical protein
LICNFGAAVIANGISFVYREKSKDRSAFCHIYDFTVSQIQLTCGNRGHWDICSLDDIEEAFRDVCSWMGRIDEFFDKFSTNDGLRNELLRISENPPISAAELALAVGIYDLAMGDVESYERIKKKALEKFSGSVIGINKINKVIRIVDSHQR